MVSPDSLSKTGASGIIGRPLIHFDQVTSTMDIAVALAEFEAPEGTVVLADLQTAGRGRSGRSWTAKAGASLMLSIILRPSASQPEHGKISLLAGLAVARTTEALSSRPTTVKWPNDVMVDGRKISGVLVQSRSMRNTCARCLILGIGFNVRSTPEIYKTHATSLSEAAGKPVELQDVLKPLILELNHVYRSFRRGNVDDAWGDLHERLAYRDQDVVIVDGDRTISGTVVGIGERGELLLRQADGGIRSIVSGELTRGPRPFTS